MRNCLGCSISEKMSKKSESRKEEALRARASTYGRVPLKDVVADCERRWFEATLKAAMSGDVTMQYLVGQMYCSGYGVAPDLKQGRIWLQKSAEVDKDARLLLASLAGGDMDVLSPLGDRGWLNYLKGNARSPHQASTKSQVPTQQKFDRANELCYDVGQLKAARCLYVLTSGDKVSKVTLQKCGTEKVKAVICGRDDFTHLKYRGYHVNKIHWIASNGHNHIPIPKKRTFMQTCPTSKKFLDPQLISSISPPIPPQQGDYPQNFIPKLINSCSSG